MNNRILLACASLVLSTSAFAAKYIPYENTETPRDRISLHLQFAASKEKQAEILAGKVSGSSPIAVMNDGVGISKDYNNFSLGLAAWYPLYNLKGFTIHGVTFVDHLPGKNVQARRLGSAQEVQELINVKTSRTNLAVGVNVFNFFKENWFYHAMVASGVTWYHAHAAFVNDNSSDNTMDHPGVTSSSPFIAGEIGIGKQLNNRSKVYGFVHYAIARRDQPLFLTGADGDDAFAKLQIPDNWLKVGIAISRDINL